MADISAIRINSEGWYAEIDLTGFDIGGTYDLDPLETNQPDDFALKFKVTSTGWDDTGSATTLDRYVYGTNYKRKVYPDSTDQAGVPDETDLGSGNCTITIALSEWIYSTDIVVLESATAGYYDDGTSSTSAESNISVTNNSGESHQLPVANWSLPGFNVVGSSMELRCVAFHRSAQQARPVRCVKFTVNDEHSNSVSVIVTTPTIDSYNDSDALPIIEYIGTLDTISLTDGDQLTANFIAYPWYGSVLDTSDAVNTMPTPLYAPQYYVLDKAGTYGKTVAVVATDGDDGTGVAIDISAFDSGSPPAAFLTIGAAANAITAYNTANHSRSDSGYGIIYLQEGSYTWADTATTTNPDTWLTVTKFPGTTTYDVIIADAATNKTVSEKIKIGELNLTNSTTICFQHMDYLWFDKTLFNPSGSATIYNPVVTYFTNCSLYNNGEYDVYGTTNSSRSLFRGNTFEENLTALIHPYTFIGNNGGSKIANYGTTGNAPQCDNMIVAFNSLKQEADTLIIGHLSSDSDGGLFTHGAAIVQNTMEKTIEGSSPALQIAADQSSGNCNNVLLWHNNVIGQRYNGAYNDYNLNNVGPVWRKHWSIKHNIFDDLNIVTDIDLHGGTPDDDRYGNHGIYHGCGSAGNFDCSRCGAGTAYRPKHSGIYSVDPGVSTDPLYVDDQSSQGGAAGNGDYTLADGSPAKDLIPSGQLILPYDLNGYERTGVTDPGAMIGFVVDPEEPDRQIIIVTAANYTPTGTSLVAGDLVILRGSSLGHVNMSGLSETESGSITVRLDGTVTQFTPKSGVTVLEGAGGNTPQILIGSDVLAGAAYII